MGEKCIFCDIYRKDINILYKTSKVFVILDINPLSKGHLMAIPIKHGAYLYDYEESDLDDVLPTIMKVVKLLEIKKFNILQNNMHIQSVLHVHFHIVPYIDEISSLKVDWAIVNVPADYVDENVKMLQKKFKLLK